MKETQTDAYIRQLDALECGHRKLLRVHALSRLDRSVEAFDLFSGLWWPLRQKSPRVPRREVSWLVAKLFGAFPLPHRRGKLFAAVLGSTVRALATDDRQRQSLERRFDQLLLTPLARIEPHLRWALAWLQAQGAGSIAIDWVELTDSLSKWEQPQTRIEWAKLFDGEGPTLEANAPAQAADETQIQTTQNDQGEHIHG
jgi:hypothetical protein